MHLYKTVDVAMYLLANFVITHSSQLNENRKVMSFHHYLCYLYALSNRANLKFRCSKNEEILPRVDLT